MKLGWERPLLSIDSIFESGLVTSRSLPAHLRIFSRQRLSGCQQSKLS